MPFVSAYFRRAPGMAAAAASAAGRRLDVAIYDVDGVNLLREATGGRYRVENLAFESGLPGGYLSASFRLAMPTARSWPGRAGLRTIIRRGNRVLWWGWIEDIRRSVRGRPEALDVTCLGPWQQLQQRLCSPNYSGTMYGDAAIATELAQGCPEISPDYTGLGATGVDLAPLTWTNQPVSDLVKVVCGAGNSAGQQLLFAVWEPSGRTTSGYPTALNTNPSFETEAFAGAGVPVGWSPITSLGDGRLVWTTQIYNSPSHGARIQRGIVAGTQKGHLGTGPSYYIAVTAGRTYTAG